MLVAKIVIGIICLALPLSLLVASFVRQAQSNRKRKTNRRKANQWESESNALQKIAALSLILSAIVFLVLTQILDFVAALF